MNQQLEERWGHFEMYKMLRAQLMDILSDDDLAYSPGGDNMTLGELCVELGETEMCYIDSFKSFTMSYVVDSDPSRAGSVVALKEWYAELHGQLQAAVEAITDEDATQRMIVRGQGFEIPAAIQIAILQEAYLIFYGKVMVYLKAMQKERPQQWTEWIA